MPRRARPESRRARVPVLAAARSTARGAGRADRPARGVLRGAAAAAAGCRRPALRDRDPRREPAHAALHPRPGRARRALLRRPARADARPAAPGRRARTARRRRAGPADRALEPARRVQVRAGESEIRAVRQARRRGSRHPLGARRTGRALRTGRAAGDHHDQQQGGRLRAAVVHRARARNRRRVRAVAQRGGVIAACAVDAHAPRSDFSRCANFCRNFASFGPITTEQ